MDLRASQLVAAALLASGACLAEPAAAAVITADTYLSAADIPANFYAGGSPTFLEDFEDGNLGGGITASQGAVLSTGALRDSVDGDDGTIDGSGSDGNSFFTISGATGILFSFAAPVTAAGVVWTDGAGATTFRAFDALGVLLDTLTVNIAGATVTGQTDEDTFFGFQNAAGIGSIFISNSSGGIEVDHVQYGNMFVSNPVVPAPVPLPAAGLLLLGGLAGLGVMSRRRRAA